MTESDLNEMSMDELFGILVKTIDEYLKLEKMRDQNGLEMKRAELYILHKVINYKKGNPHEP